MTQPKKEEKISSVSKNSARKKLEQDPIAKLILSSFDSSLKKDFVSFLQAKELSTATKKAPSGNKSKEKTEKVSFKEVTSYHNPLLTSSMFSTPIPTRNPETITCNTFTAMRRDHQLASGLAVIKLPILSLDWTVECDDINIAKTVEWALGRIWRDLIKSALMAVDYGFSTHEKVWERNNVKVSHVSKDGKEEVYHNGDLVYYKKVKPHHPESISMVFDDKQNLTEVVQEGSESGQSEISLPIRKCFIFTHDKEFGNPFGVSRLKNAYKIWYWKQLLYQFMMQYFERRGIPPTVATAPPGRTQDSSGNEVENLEMALRLASSLISSSVAAIPYQTSKDSNGENMWKLEILKDDARGPMFIEALDHLDNRALRAIFIPESVWASGDSSGGYGGSSIQADLFLMTEKGLITDLEESINAQLVTPFLQANFPSDKIKPCLVKFAPLDWNRKITLKELFVEMIRNVDTMIQMGVSPKILPDLEKMADILEIPVSTWEDATGLSPQDLFDAAHPPVPDFSGKEEGGSEEEDKTSGKVAGRKTTRRQNVNQTQDRRKINPGGRRADRIRVPDPQKKQ